MSNMRDRFILRRGAEKLLRGKRALLVDDVLTSGATASACARALLEGGAGLVDLLTAARTLRYSAA
jgi:predicted amidophosphoribosyltransferase